MLIADGIKNLLRDIQIITKKRVVAISIVFNYLEADHSPFIDGKQCHQDQKK